METLRILAINPGSTSTKIAVYDNENEVFETTLRHSTEKISEFENIFSQYDFRKEVILKVLDENNINLSKLDAVVGRGGLLRPIEGGTYLVDEDLLEDLKVGVLGQHASNLGGIIANEIASGLNIPAYIVDPVVVDELEPIARISGIPELERKSIFHALNQKAVARKFANQVDKKYEELNLIVAHMGGGISVGAHQKGRVIDVNNGLDGDGAFSPERSGGLPVGDLVRLCYSGKYDLNFMKGRVKGNGGLTAYLNTNDARDVEKMIDNGDEKAELIYNAMGYQVAKEIGAAAVVLKGKLDGILLTGGLAYSERLTSFIKENVDFLGKVYIFPGEDEMEALVMGGLRVLNGEEEAKKY